MRLSLMICALWMCISGTAAAADDVPRPGISWNGSLSAGVELDPAGLPKDEKPAASKPSRLRVGFAARWSFSLNWERVPPQADVNAISSPDISAEESQLVVLTNDERKKLKLSSLVPDHELMKIARAQALAMAQLDLLSHELEGNTFAKRIGQSGYHAARAGENIAEGQQTASDVVTDWMKSPGHKENILQPEFTRIGIGHATSKSGKRYYAQVFAKPMVNDE
jgi:uncharacterized protein YkwD